MKYKHNIEPSLTEMIDELWEYEIYYLTLHDVESMAKASFVQDLQSRTPEEVINHYNSTIDNKE